MGKRVIKNYIRINENDIEMQLVLDGLLLEIAKFLKGIDTNKHTLFINNVGSIRKEAIKIINGGKYTRNKIKKEMRITEEEYELYKKIQVDIDGFLLGLLFMEVVHSMLDTILVGVNSVSRIDNNMDINKIKIKF